MLDSAVGFLVILNVLGWVVAEAFEVRVKVGLGEKDACAVGAFEVLIVVCGVAHDYVNFRLYAIRVSIVQKNKQKRLVDVDEDFFAVQFRFVPVCFVNFTAVCVQ